MRSCLPVMLCVGVTGEIAASARGQWVVTPLNPAGASESYCATAGDRQQCGIARVFGARHASLWSMNTASWIDLNPLPLSSDSAAYATRAGRQAGFVRQYSDMVYRAALWSGTAASWVDLHPADTGATESGAYDLEPGAGANAGRQVGYATIGGRFHAGTWSGSAASWVDLHPANATESVAYAAGNGQQAGYAEIDGVRSASLWSRSAASWVNLNPSESGASVVYAIDEEQQAGIAAVGGPNHAALWSGSAASVVDLHPAGALQSGVYAASGGRQVGYTTLASGPVHASMWTGTAESWVDLHELLPASYTASWAVGISSDGTSTFVSGDAYNATSGRWEAVLWTRGHVCRSDFDQSGGLAVADIFGFLNAWLAGDPRADFNGDGRFTAQDIFGFLGAWFAGC